MDYINFVDIENKKIYDLGKYFMAKHYLPYFAYKYNNKPIIFYGDETHNYLEDRYNLKQYGGEYEEGLIEHEDYNDEILLNIEMPLCEFNEIFDKIAGKEITNLEDYIRYKYRP